MGKAERGCVLCREDEATNGVQHFCQVSLSGLVLDVCFVTTATCLQKILFSVSMVTLFYMHTFRSSILLHMYMEHFDKALCRQGSMHVEM